MNSYPDIPALMSTKELASLLQMSHRTVEDWRRTGAGPVFCSFNGKQVRYLREDVLTWLRQLASNATGLLHV